MKIAPELIKALRKLGVQKAYPKKFTLVDEGEVSKFTYFVEEGCVRLWYNNDGKDVSVKFFLPGEICASLESFFHETPSKYVLDTITPCILRRITKAEADAAAADTPELLSYFTSVMVHCMADYQDLFVDRIGNSPEERYRALIEQDPDVHEIVPLHYIASYLGVTSVSLSRIRKKIRLLNKR